MNKLRFIEMDSLIREMTGHIFSPRCLSELMKASRKKEGH